MPMPFRIALSAIAVAGFLAMPGAPALADDPALTVGDPEAGARVFRQCQACHVVDQEVNRVGPHLVGIINRPIAEADGFRYSPIYLEHREDGKVWDYDALVGYLTNPREYMPGNRMAFAGLRSLDQIHDVIAYMRENGGVWEN
ncbi:MAG: cytochrome c family protein [Geminicoccaceae bacterium]|nr:MAG: cytochrome c family protein [Geminicoccaceae bacterium]